jgi:hypothetical protein
MTDVTISRTFGAAPVSAAQPPGQAPDANRRGLCIYCRTAKFVYWPPASRLPSATCPGCQRREPDGRNVARPGGPPGGRPGGRLSVTSKTVDGSSSA